MRDIGQLCSTVEDVRDDRTVARMDGSSFQVPHLERDEFAIAVQSELWRIRFDVRDRPSRRSKYELFFGPIQERRLCEQRSQSWTNVETFDSARCHLV